MAFKEVLDLDCDATVSLGGTNKKTGKANPTRVEGYYIGTKDTPSRKSKNGIAKLHILQTSKGNLGVWGKTDLDRKMASVVAGAMIRVTQNGSIPTPNGDMYKFKVEMDPENTIDVSGLAANNSTSNQSEDNSSETSSYSSEESEDEDLFGSDQESTDEIEYTPPRAPAKSVAVSAPNAERAAKVQALLNGKSRPRT